MPVRQTPHGDIEVLLITSRETRRWVIPKGWPWPDHTDHDSAAGEAREEAGVIGHVEPTSFGRYMYAKRMPDRTAHIAVDVYVLWVEKELADWPERDERSRAWFSPVKAADAVDEPQLRAMLRATADLSRHR